MARPRIESLQSTVEDEERMSSCSVTAVLQVDNVHSESAPAPSIVQATNILIPTQDRLSGRQSYIAVDPFSPSVAHMLPHNTNNAPAVDSVLFRRPTSPDLLPPLLPTSAYVSVFLCDVLLRHIYLLTLLRLPSLYLSRVARVFEKAERNTSDIRETAIVTANSNTNGLRVPLIQNVIVPPSYTRLTAEWEYFIETLVKEWKTLTIVSVVLQIITLATLHIDDASDDSISRNAALLSLFCAMMSFLFGCVYIIRFNNMRKAHEAAEWAEEAQRTRTSTWWNVWVLLAMPSVWLSWSIIFYLVSLFVSIWHVPNNVDDYAAQGLSLSTTLGLQITITVVFGLGALYVGLVMATFRRHGAGRDSDWQKRMAEWVKEASQSKESAIADDTASRPQSTSMA